MKLLHKYFYPKKCLRKRRRNKHNHLESKNIRVCQKNSHNNISRRYRRHWLAGPDAEFCFSLSLYNIILLYTPHRRYQSNDYFISCFYVFFFFFKFFCYVYMCVYILVLVYYNDGAARLRGKSKIRVANASKFPTSDSCGPVVGENYNIQGTHNVCMYIYNTCIDRVDRAREEEKPWSFLFLRLLYAHTTTPKLITQMASYSNSMSGKLPFFPTPHPTNLVYFHCMRA